MRTSRFASDEIVDALQKAANGTPVRELCIAMDISETTFYKWKNHYTGLAAKGIDDARELRRENARLRNMVYVQRIEIDVLNARLNTSGKITLESEIAAGEARRTRLASRTEH